MEKPGNYPRSFLFQPPSIWSPGMPILPAKEVLNPFLFHGPQFFWKMAIASLGRGLLPLGLSPPTHLPCCSEGDLSEIFHLVMSGARNASILGPLLLSKAQTPYHDKQGLVSLALCAMLVISQHSYPSTLL